MRSYRTLFLSLCFWASTTVSFAQSVVNIDALGGNSNGNFDNAAIIQNAVNNLQTGQQLFFPCSNGSMYKTTQPIDFSHLVDMSVRGAGNGCYIGYFGNPGTLYAFSLQGAERVKFADIQFITGSSSAPRAVLLLARPASNPSGQSGQFILDNVHVEGYATVAQVVSIASEENHWNNPTIINNGGGAATAFYTSGTDSYSICSGQCPTGSNLSLWMHGGRLLDFTGISTHNLISDEIRDSGAGDHHYYDLYQSSAGSCNTISDLAPAWYYGPAHGRLTFDNIRCENARNMFYFNAPFQAGFADITITNNRFDTGVAGSRFIDMAVSPQTTIMDNFYVAHNAIGQPGNTTAGQIGEWRHSLWEDSIGVPAYQQIDPSAMLLDLSGPSLQWFVPGLANGPTQHVCVSGNQLIGC